MQSIKFPEHLPPLSSCRGQGLLKSANPIRIAPNSTERGFSALHSMSEGNAVGLSAHPDVLSRIAAILSSNLQFKNPTDSIDATVQSLPAAENRAAHVSPFPPKANSD